MRAANDPYPRTPWRWRFPRTHRMCMRLASAIPTFIIVWSVCAAFVLMSAAGAWYAFALMQGVSR